MGGQQRRQKSAVEEEGKASLKAKGEVMASLEASGCRFDEVEHPRWVFLLTVFVPADLQKSEPECHLFIGLPKAGGGLRLRQPVKDSELDPAVPLQNRLRAFETAGAQCGVNAVARASLGKTMLGSTLPLDRAEAAGAAVLNFRHVLWAFRRGS